MIEFGIVVLIVCALVDRSNLNTFFDYFVPVYCIFAIAGIVSFVKAKKAASQENTSNSRVYVYENAGDWDKLPWKKQFATNWECNTNEGLKEFLVFNGAPAFLAGGLAKTGCKMTVTVSDDETEPLVSYSVTGIPKAEVAAIKHYASEESAVAERRPGPKEDMDFKFWINEETKTFHMESVEIKSQKRVLAARRLIPEEGKVEATMTAYKPNGDTAKCKLFFFRK